MVVKIKQVSKSPNGVQVVTEHADGTYQKKIPYIDPLTGQKKRKTIRSTKSKADVLRKEREFRTQLKKQAEEVLNEVKSQRDYTLREWLLKYLVDYKKSALKQKTYERYQSLIRCNITPYKIADCKLIDLDIATVQNHLIYLHNQGGQYGDGLAPRSVNATRRLLIAAIDKAMDLELVYKNVAARTTAFRPDEREIQVLSHKQADKLLYQARKMNYHAWIIIVLALGTGLRCGEIFGLEKANIDFEAKTLRVVKTVVTTDKGILVQDSGKTKAAKRTVPLPDFVVYALRRYMLWCKAQGMRFGYKYEASPWLLSNPEGNPRSPSSFSAHQYKECLARAGLGHNIRLHDLRHTHATWLLEAGVPVKVVSERLGHSSIRITLDIYSHVLGSMQAQAVNALNSIFVNQ